MDSSFINNHCIVRVTLVSVGLILLQQHLVCRIWAIWLES